MPSYAPDISQSGHLYFMQSCTTEKVWLQVIHARHVHGPLCSGVSWRGRSWYCTPREEQAEFWEDYSRTRLRWARPLFRVLSTNTCRILCISNHFKCAHFACRINSAWQSVCASKRKKGMGSSKGSQRTQLGLWLIVFRCVGLFIVIISILYGWDYCF